jgi:hypothetical protein
MRVTSSVLLGTQLIFHRRCRRKRSLLLVSVAGFVVFVGILVTNGSALGYWLFVTAVLHGVDVARSQIAWHGLLDSGETRPLFRTTVNWVNRDVWAQIGVQSPAAEGLVAKAETRSLDPAANTYPGVAPHPSSTWAFNDNLHQIHHLHSSMHFLDYPAALVDAVAGEQTRPIMMDLARIEFFPERCWRRRFDDIAETLLVSPQACALDSHAVQVLLRADSSVRSPLAAAAEEVGLCRRLDRQLSRLIPMI